MSDRSLIDVYQTGAEKVSQAIKGLSRENLLAFPVPGTWSIQQIVLHLSDSEQVFADRIKRVIAEENATLLSFDENRWTQDLHYDMQSAEDAAALIGLTRRQIVKILRSLPESAFDRMGTHNVAGPTSLRDLVGKAANHLDHHLKFVIEKRAKLGV